HGVPIPHFDEYQHINLGRGVGDQKDLCIVPVSSTTYTESMHPSAACASPPTASPARMPSATAVSWASSRHSRDRSRTLSPPVLLMGVAASWSLIVGVPSSRGQLCFVMGVSV